MAHDKSGHESLQGDMYFGGRTPQPTPSPSGLLQGQVMLKLKAPDCDPMISYNSELPLENSTPPVQNVDPQSTEQQAGPLLPLVREGGRRILGTPHN